MPTKQTQRVVVEKSAPVSAKENEVIEIVPKRKILFVASECTPYIATGGLAEVVGSLSRTLVKNPRFDVRVVLPLYSDVKTEQRRKMTFLGNINVPLSWRNQYCGVFKLEEEGVTLYFLDNEYYFKRVGCYGYYDDGERFAFFGKAVMEILPFIDFYPDLLHAHDWQAASASIYLKTEYAKNERYRSIRSLFTIHNIEYQGKFDPSILGDLFGISEEFRPLVEYDGAINLMKGAIECSERFSTVSPTYAQEIKTEQYAHGLAPIVRRNESKLSGILNGIDVDFYNCATDSALFANFNEKNTQNKNVCKAELQKMLSLSVKDVPIISMITRLASHKGLDLVTEVIETVLQEDVQFVLLGTGEACYENYFKDLASRYAGKVASVIAFNGDLSRKIYSGSDIFLMPSKSEPCGLSQMIATRYATIPIVRETGGLFDSIKSRVNGFSFSAYNAYDMLYVIREALTLYQDKTEWNALMQRALKSDFSWTRSAEEYAKLYEQTLQNN